MGIDVILILLAVGIFAGILSGLFGVGGGIIIVPALLAVYSYTNFNSPYAVHIAIATSLFTIIFTSISSAHKHFGHGNVNWKAATIIGISSAVTIYFFSKIAISLPGESLKKIFSFVLVVVAAKMLFDKKRDENDDEASVQKEKTGVVISVFIGGLSGVIAAFSGLGGGGFIVPLMHYLMKFRFKKAIGTSSAAILFTAVAGVISYFLNTPQGTNPIPYSFGMVDTLSALPVIAASIPFARVGVYLNKKTHPFILAKLFAVFILAVSVKIIFF